MEIPDAIRKQSEAMERGFKFLFGHEDDDPERAPDARVLSESSGGRAGTKGDAKRRKQ